METILLVEEAGGRRKLAKQALERSGYRVLEAANGSEALSLSERHGGAIHLVVNATEGAGSVEERLSDQLCILRPGLMRIRPSVERSVPLSPRTPSHLAASPAGVPFNPDHLLRAVKSALGASLRRPRGHHT